MRTTANKHTDTLRVYGNLSLLEMAPVLLALDRYYPGPSLLEHGSVISLWGQSSDLPSLAASGESDVAANSETQALRYSFDHPDMRFIFTIAECPYRIVARRSAGIARLEDLKAKRIGVMLKSSSQYFLDRMLHTVGLSDRDVVMINYMAKTEAPLSLMPQALRRGELDAVTVWEPQMQQTRLAVGDDAIEFCSPALYREIFSLCSTQAKLRDPALRPRIVSFVRAVMEATDELKRDPSRAQALVAQHAAVDIEIVRDAWPYLTYPGTLAVDVADALVPADAWVAKEKGRTGRSHAEMAKLVDASVVREALGA